MKYFYVQKSVTTIQKSSGLTSALLIGGAMAALFWLERRRPLRESRPEPDRERLPRNFMIAASAALVVRICERPLVEPLSRCIDRSEAGLLPHLKLSPLPEKVLGVILLDYSLYWWHVLLHRLPFLWRCHVVHHSDLVLDTSTALRFHWLEFLASIPWRLGQVALLDIRPATLELWQKLTFVEVLFHHSNLRLPVEWERRLGILVVTPRLHGIHHSVKPEETDTNYSSGLTLWDVLHGTLKNDVPQETIEIGVCEYHRPHQLSVSKLLSLPFHPEHKT